ncbi:HypC/HybG/HupF family hydrogenase formation chaperone [Thiomicrorhabdus sp. ZW0627]|uniref:HypC/HybG/HupF family hydrogenase formation chaperone n=1 Tax=Thiomicrorhabdus sp. ZW0627 TaxID=3039774 RepID=UPI0024363EE1|nr:HypC/HybG/HupF family hydrogenase formation chaperone [Thiomicrorhabdus sp. ZW0627]MDG6774148.1 HypC/HybG/HupF family hydrogenase formation chaperone [Thiomicrorhabdus sp. ZW0627]
MCLSIPSKVIQIDDANIATVDTMGVQRQVSLDLMPEAVDIGDYVLIHVGFAMNKIDQEDALESLKLYREMADLIDAEDANLRQVSS